MNKRQKISYFWGSCVFKLICSISEAPSNVATRHITENFEKHGYKIKMNDMTTTGESLKAVHRVAQLYK